MSNSENSFNYFSITSKQVMQLKKWRHAFVLYTVLWSVRKLNHSKCRLKLYVPVSPVFAIVNQICFKTFNHFESKPWHSCIKLGQNLVINRKIHFLIFETLSRLIGFNHKYSKYYYYFLKNQTFRAESNWFWDLKYPYYMYIIIYK